MDYKNLKMFKNHNAWMEHKRNGGKLNYNTFRFIKKLKK